MAINPNIALAVKPVEIADPMAMYGKIAAIQGAQNQNALAQYQLGAAQRAEAKDIARTNALSQAGTDDTAIANALLRSGDLKGYTDFIKSQRETQKAELELFDTSMKQIRDMWGRVRTPEDALAVHDATHRDPLIGRRLAALGLTEPMGRQQIMQAAQNPQSFADFVQRAQLGAEKFMELNKPTITSQNLGGQVRLVQTPGLGGATTVVPGSIANVTMSPYEAARIGQENQRLAQEATGVVYQEDANGNIVALPSKLRKGEVPTARVAVAPGGGFQPLAAKPSEAVGKEQMSINQQRAIVKGALDAVEGTPSAFGFTEGAKPEAIRSRMASSAENQARSYLFNVVSGVIKERAGTAQSAAEAETLSRFLPQPTDNADVIKDKLKGFDKYLTDKEAGTTKKRPVAEKSKPSLSGMDQQALEWANANPSDPRAAQIKQRLGM